MEKYPFLYFFSLSHFAVNGMMEQHLQMSVVCKWPPNVYPVKMPKHIALPFKNEYWLFPH